MTFNEYLEQAKNIFDRNPNKEFSFGIDVRVTVDLIKNDIPFEEIKEIISELSPANKVPGIAPNYSDTVIEAAIERINFSPLWENQEKSRYVAELLKNAPESGNSKPTVVQAYKIEAAKEISKEKRWAGPSTDVKIAQSLLSQGYDRGKINAAISRQSPETLGKSQEEARKYSIETTKNALTPEIKRQVATFSAKMSYSR